MWLPLPQCHEGGSYNLEGGDALETYVSSFDEAIFSFSFIYKSLLLKDACFVRALAYRCFVMNSLASCIPSVVEIVDGSKTFLVQTMEISMEVVSTFHHHSIVYVHRSQISTTLNS